MIRQLVLCAFILSLCACGGVGDSDSSSSTSSSSSSTSSSSSSGDLKGDLVKGKSQYLEMCSGCHGDKGQSTAIPINYALSLQEMVVAVRDTMPKGAPGKCDANCAQNVSAYIKTVLSSNENKPDKPLTEAACTEEHYLPPRMIRLSGAELQEHIRTALPGASEGPLGRVNFQSDHLEVASARNISSAEFGVYFSAVKDIAKAYAADSSSLASCRGKANDTKCLSDLNKAAERLYRRPLDKSEWDPFADMYKRLSKDQGAEQAAAAILSSALVAPQTLYQSESGDSPGKAGVYPLTQRERLSLARYSLTGRGPTAEELNLLGRSAEDFDEGLSDFAASWASTPEFAERMVDLSERVFGVEYLASVQREEKVFTPAVHSAMGEQFRNFVRDAMLSPDGSFANLFLNNPTNVPSALKDIYKNDSLSPGGKNPRMGILGLPALLTTLAGSGESDPVMRGLLIRDLLLCETLPSPPPDVSFDQVKVTEDMQTRERFEVLSSTQPCGTCHQTINPPGYLFENFDHLGRYRIEEKGRPVDAVSTITPPFGGSPYDGVGQWDGIVPLAKWLAESPDARRCFAANFAGFVLSDTVPLKLDNCNMNTVSSRFAETGLVADLVADVVRSPLFSHRTREGN